MYNRDKVSKNNVGLNLAQLINSFQSAMQWYILILKESGVSKEISGDIIMINRLRLQ